MIWAIKNNERITANPKQKAWCPICNNKVISKCGSIKIWHWAHKSNFECDSFKEPETKWHREWKENFPKECQEIIIKKIKYITNLGIFYDEIKENFEIDLAKKHNIKIIYHIADIKTKKGLLIEFQNSPISSKEIIEREKFYDNMIWVLNGKTIGKNLGYSYSKKRKRFSYHWKWFPKSWGSSKKPIYIDKGNDNLIYVNLFNKDAKKLSKIAFIIEQGGNPFK